MRPKLIEPDWIYGYDEEAQAEGFQDEYQDLARCVRTSRTNIFLLTPH